MRRLLLGLCCLAPATFVTGVAPAKSPAEVVRYPAGDVIYRPGCYETEMDEEASYYGSGRSGGVANPSSPSATITMGSSRKNKLGASPKPKPSKAPRVSAPIESGMIYDMTEEAEPIMMLPPPPPPEPAPDLGSDDDHDIVYARPTDRKLQSALDWGGTIYLSNDDSMSLASAQRLIYAVQHGYSFTVPQIRPHELLNYFSFDTVAPDVDQVFDVQVSAEKTGDDTLTMALAVRGAMPERQPLDLTVVVDRSGSMGEAGRMDYTRKGLQIMSDQLLAGDRLDIVLFDDEICTPLQNYVVGRDDPELLNKTIRQMRPRGSTDLDLGLREGYRLAKSHEDVRQRNRRVMLLTDAMLNTGDVNHDTVSEIGRAFDKDNIRLTGIGVGRDFNDDVLDKLTEKGKGAFVYLGSEAVVERVFGVGFPSLVQTIAHDVQFRLDLPKSLAMERFYGEESSTKASDIQPINYYAGTSQVFLQDLTIDHDKFRGGDEVTFTAIYKNAITGEPEERSFHTSVGAMLESDRHNVRKARALMSWSDTLITEAMTGGCGSELAVYAERSSLVSEDVEIAFVDGLVEKMCGVQLAKVEHPVDRKLVDYKVKVDSDIPIAEVSLECGTSRLAQSLSSSDTVAKFSAPAGSCTLELQGNVGMRTSVNVPVTGGDLRCVIRGGRMSCS
jgi:Ca-activated chloride channel homolog